MGGSGSKFNFSTYIAALKGDHQSLSDKRLPKVYSKKLIKFGQILKKGKQCQVYECELDFGFIFIHFAV